jgi:hypothetical protein
MNFGYFRIMKSETPKWKKLVCFIALYLIISFLFVPPIAKYFGRVHLPIIHTENLIPHSLITPLLNRHYVKPELKKQLFGIAESMNSDNPSLKVSYLDANFPFIDGFPLLPHLSHNDGRKIDLSFYYTLDNKKGNLKPSNSGYGKYVEPTKSEFNQTRKCKSKGYWHYDYTKFLSLGGRNDLEFDINSTKNLVTEITNELLTQKLLIEPHLKTRMGLSNSKIRFQGCHAVRHDDHIHYQIKK